VTQEIESSDADVAPAGIGTDVSAVHVPLARVSMRGAGVANKLISPTAMHEVTEAHQMPLRAGDGWSWLSAVGVHVPASRDSTSASSPDLVLAAPTATQLPALGHDTPDRLE